MTNIQRSILLALLFFGIVSMAAYADDWPYSDGVTVGCNIGQSETSIGENFDMYEATEQYALEIGQVDYRNGVIEGYESCQYVPPQPSAPSPGVTYCSIDLAEDDPEYQCGCSDPFCADQD